MTFNEARQLLRSMSDSVSMAPDRHPGVTEYHVFRIEEGQCHRWLLTADDIEAGVFRDQSLAQQSN